MEKTRWAIGQIAVCHCDPANPRRMPVVKGRTHQDVPPVLGDDDNGGEPHECLTATRPRNVGRPGVDSTMIRLSVSSIEAARAAASRNGLSPRVMIETAIEAAIAKGVQ